MEEKFKQNRFEEKFLGCFEKTKNLGKEFKLVLILSFNYITKFEN